MPGPVLSIQILAGTQDALRHIQRFVQAINEGFEQAADTVRKFVTETVAAFSVTQPAASSKPSGSKAEEGSTRALGKPAAVQVKVDELEADSFYGRLHRHIVQLTDEWGNMAAQMAEVITGTVTHAMQGLSGAIANVIVGTQNAGQAFAQLGIQMLTSFIANVVQMILMATVAIPLLTALGVLSGGSIPTAGLAATTVALAGASSLAGRYAAGGPIRSGSGPRADDVMIRASRGEYVLNAAAVNYYGEAFISALNQRMVNLRDIADTIPRGVSRPLSRGAYAEGGYVDQGTGGGNVTVAPAPVHIHDVRVRQDFLDVLASQAGQHIVLDHVTKNKHRIGLRA